MADSARTDARVERAQAVARLVDALLRSETWRPDGDEKVRLTAKRLEFTRWRVTHEEGQVDGD